MLCFMLCFSCSRINDSLAIYDMSDKTSSAFMESFDAEESAPTNTEKTAQKMQEFVTVDDMNKYSLIIKEEIEKISGRLEKISESAQGEERINALQEEVENLKQYASYLAEEQNKAIKYAEYLAEKLSQGIEYTEHVAEKLTKVLLTPSTLLKELTKVFSTLSQFPRSLVRQLNTQTT